MRKFRIYMITMMMCMAFLSGCGKASENNLSQVSGGNKAESEGSKSVGGASVFTVSNSSGVEQKELEIAESGYVESSSIGDTTYLYAYAKVYNPNDSLMAEYPKLTATVKNQEGVILATDYHTGGYIMPKDTIVMVESIGVTNYTDDCKIDINVSTDFTNVKNSVIKENSTSKDFAFTNVSEITEKYNNKITGEIINNFTQNVDCVLLTVMLRKNEEIVYIDTTFVDDLQMGQNTAFEYDYYSKNWPDHDSIELSAQQW